MTLLNVEVSSMRSESVTLPRIFSVFWINDYTTQNPLGNSVSCCGHRLNNHQFWYWNNCIWHTLTECGISEAINEGSGTKNQIPSKWTEAFPCQCFKPFYLFMLIVEAHPVDGITERLHAAKTLILVFILHFSYLDVFNVNFCIILYLSYFFMFASFQCCWSFIKSVCFIKVIVYLILCAAAFTIT